MTDNRQWLLQRHANVEFGKAKVYSRFENFVASNVAAAVVRLPIDLLVWATVFYLGYRLGVGR